MSMLGLGKAEDLGKEAKWGASPYQVCFVRDVCLWPMLALLCCLYAAGHRCGMLLRRG